MGANTPRFLLGPHYHHYLPATSCSAPYLAHGFPSPETPPPIKHGQWFGECGPWTNRPHQVPLGNFLGSSFPEKSHQGWRDPQWPHQPIITNRERWQEPWRKRSERKKPYQEMVRQGSLECCTSRGFRVRHDWVTEQHKELDAKFSFPLNTQRTRAEFISSFPEYIPLSQPENFKNCKSYKAGLGLLFRWMPRLKWWEQGWYILKKANDMISNYTEDIQLVNNTLKTLKNHESLGKCSKTNWKLRDSSTHLLKGLILTIGTDVEKLELLQCRWKRKGEQSF